LKPENVLFRKLKFAEWMERENKEEI